MVKEPMKRRFPYITVRRIVEDINVELKDYYLSKGMPEAQIPEMSRVSFYRMEDRLGFPKPEREEKGWRRYSFDQAEDIKTRIREYFKYPNPAEQKDE